MRKNFVLDTNVLLHDPDAILYFQDNTVIVPIYVVEEIDKFKRELSERGRNARQAARLLDAYREKGNLSEGVKLENGGLIKVLSATNGSPQHVLDKKLADNLILAVALDAKRDDPEAETIFVTKDTSLRIRANAMGVQAVNFEESETDIDQLYPGATEVTIDSDLFKTFFKEGEVAIDYTPVAQAHRKAASAELEQDDEILDSEQVLHPNEYLLLRDVGRPNQTALGRLDDASGLVKPLRNFTQGVWGIRPRNKEQHFALDALLNPDIKLVTLLGKAGTGKAQPLDAKVLTPRGWKRMGQIEVGHEVMTPKGTSARVLGVFPQGEKEIYRVRFTDGSSTECCREHLWYTWTALDRDYKRPGSVKTLEEIMGSLRYGAQQKRNHSIPISKAIEFEASTLPLDPYLMGCLIGDGAMSVGSPCLSSGDPFIVEACRPLLEQVGCYFGTSKGADHPIFSPSTGAPAGTVVRLEPSTGEEKHYPSRQTLEEDGFVYTSVCKAIKRPKVPHHGYWWRREPSAIRSKNGVKNALLEVGLWGCRSETKFVPPQYLFGSQAQRLALLQGLMDTDGTIGKGGHASFTTVSPRLADDFKFLVQSLGGTVTTRERQTHYTHKGERRMGKLSYRCNVCVEDTTPLFRLPRKLSRQKPRRKYHPRRYIDCVEYVGRKEAQCILIDHPDHLYLTDDCIVTHNTLCAVAAGLAQTAGDHIYKRLLVARPIFPLGRDIGYLPGDLEQKLNPWMQPIRDNIEYLMGLARSGSFYYGNGMEELMNQGILELEPLTFIRGRSIPGQFMVVDEAQNLTPHEIKTILTRAGDGTKIVLTGDPYQIDNPYVDSESNGLTYTITRFKGQSIFATVTMSKGERSELAEIAANLL